ncbi:MAG: hypothetical protein OXD33_02530 [Rhodobacteraceae bacterium]|nr:hypothetical protein [Paracoccaceae bacterium]
MTKSRLITATDSPPDKLARKPMKLDEFTAAMQQLMATKPNTKSENREPMRCELDQRFRMIRRD